jgi:hypothetical protein
MELSDPLKTTYHTKNVNQQLFIWNLFQYGEYLKKYGKTLLSHFCKLSKSDLLSKKTW